MRKPVSGKNRWCDSKIAIEILKYCDKEEGYEEN